MYASRPPSPMIPQHSLPGGRYPLPGPDFHRLDRASFAWRTQTDSEIAQGSPLEAGKLMQHRDDALAVMDIRRRDGDRQREAVLVHSEMDFDALDLLAAVKAAPEASRCRTTGAAVDDDGAGFGSIAASLPPSLDQAVEQPAPQAKPGPASKQRVQRAERNSWPIARHCMPQKHTHQIAMIALRSGAPTNGGFGPERVDRVPAMAPPAPRRRRHRHRRRHPTRPEKSWRG